MYVGTLYVCMYIVCMYVCMYAISEQKVGILRIRTHKSSSFCLISATEFKLLLSPLLENLILHFSQFCRAEWQVNTQNKAGKVPEEMEYLSELAVP